MANLVPISVKQFLVTISGQTFNFSSKKGAKVDRFEETYVSPTTGKELKHYSFQKNDNITLGKMYDATNDKALVTFLQTQMTTPTLFNVAIQPVDTTIAGAVIAGAATITYTNCQVKSYTLPDVDRDGTGLAKMEVELSFEEATLT